MKKVLYRALLVLLSVAFSLALGEALLRSYERRALSLSAWLDADPLDLAKLKFNDTQVSRAKPAGEFRLLSFGDSFAYSIMSPRFSYAGLIASNLNRTLTRPKIRVVNFGEGATTVRDYAAAHAFWAERIEHDAALFNIYMGNDILDVAYSYTQPKWSPNHLYLNQEYELAAGMKKSPVPHKFPLRILDYAYALYLTQFKMVKTPPAPPAAPPANHEERFNPAANHNLSEEVFLNTNQIQLVNFEPSKMGSLADGYRAIVAFFRYVSNVRRRGTKVLVVLSPNQAQVESALRERIAAFNNLDLSVYDLTLPARTITAIRDRVAPEVELLDLSPYFVCASEKGEDLYYLTNTHWGPEGNALAARIIADYLGRSWFSQAPAGGDSGCDVAAYRARFAKVDQAEILRFVQRIVASTGSQSQVPARTPW
jgi:hypothetical protein